MKAIAILLLACACWCWSTPAPAHRASSAFVELRVDENRIGGQWEIALRDLPLLVDLDQNRDRRLSWGELQAGRESLVSVLGTRLELSSGGTPCPLEFGDLMVNERSDGRYAWLALSGRCEHEPHKLSVRYELLFDRDPTHRGLVLIRAGQERRQMVFSPTENEKTVSLRARSRLSRFGASIHAGVAHGLHDLMLPLFLLVLLAPVAYRRGEEGWTPDGTMRDGVLVGGSGVIALACGQALVVLLATTGLFRLAPAFAALVAPILLMLAALNNLRPRFLHRRWAIAGLFGAALAPALFYDGSRTTWLDALLQAIGGGLGTGMLAAGLAALIVLLATRLRARPGIPQAITLWIPLAVAVYAAVRLAFALGFG